MPIPTGFKATHAKVYASASTASAVTVRQYDQTDGDCTSTTSGAFNATIDMVDIVSSATANVVLKIAPNSSATVIYGADITIEAV